MQSPYDRLQLSSDAQTTFIEDEPKIGYAKPSKPIVPELCLESIWIESIGTRCVIAIKYVKIHIFIDFFLQCDSTEISLISQRAVFCIVTSLDRNSFATC